ncbi:MAG: HD domain-containing protein [Endomicrobium sp.]|jgi:poly(A) polymerase|nr:HD domain-containing protein [Endomicrobium sp.]
MNKLNELINKVNNSSQNFDVYAVGGFSRDIILKRKYNDIDLVVDKDVINYSKKIAYSLKSKLINLDNASKTYRIMLKNNVVTHIDISHFMGKTIEQDLQNRDFTINAIAFNIKYFKNFKEHLILNDRDTLDDLLKYKIINTVSLESFIMDPLRMLRAFRLAAELNFSVSQKTLKQIRSNAKSISKVAYEKIKNEFFRTLSVENSTIFIKKMDKCGLLSEIFSEIGIMKETCNKYYYHPGGLFQHSFETMKSVENILNNLEKYFPENFLDIQQHFRDDNVFSENITRSGLLKFTALFHDNAKPETAKFERGKLHFLEHEEVGAKKIEKIMSTMKFSKKDVEFVTLLVKQHMRPSVLTRSKVITRRALLKFFKNIGDNTADLIILAMSDWHSYRRLNVFPKEILKFQEKSVREIIKFYYELKKLKPIPKIIDGNIIMKKFDLKPGPLIGKLLYFVSEAQKKGKIYNTNEALDLVFSKIKHMKLYKLNYDR